MKKKPKEKTPSSIPEEKKQLGINTKESHPEVSNSVRYKIPWIEVYRDTGLHDNK